MANKIVLDDQTKAFIRSAVPDGLVSPSGHRFVAFLEKLVKQVNEANGFVETTVIPVSSDTTAPTETTTTTVLPR